MRYARQAPEVSLLRDEVDELVDSVSSDDHDGIRMAVDHLTALSHRRIVLVDGGTAVRSAVPTDVSVLGYDDSQFARICYVQLSFISQDEPLLAPAAVDRTKPNHQPISSARLTW